MKGKLIVFEGIDGVGKSTHAKLLRDFLTSKGHSVQLLKEPTGGQFGQEIKALALEGRNLDAEKEYALFMLDRWENVQNNILPALNRGDIVILDRYYFSTMAYQGALGLSTSRIREENEEFAPIPNLVILLELSVDKALKRISDTRKEKANHFETEDYLKKVKSIFDTFNDTCIIRMSVEDSINETKDKIIKVVMGKTNPLLMNMSSHQ